jgi:dienelactone hydrolase
MSLRLASAALFPWVAILGAAVAADGPAEPEALARRLRGLDAAVLSVDGAGVEEPARMLPRHARARLQAANARETELWNRVQTLEEWRAYRDERLDRLRQSLGRFPEPPERLDVRLTGSRQLDGVRIENLVFLSRPGLAVTANLYRPAPQPGHHHDAPGAARGGSPGILICHSHHNPKSQSELVDLGMLWARAGCLVMVMDQLGHGERRIHPFRSAADYAIGFRPGRQDYYFRYNAELLLAALGDSLIGWMAWDLSRGVDLLLSLPEVDPRRIVLLGAVAGGGDPAAVTAAIDERIGAVVPFNFGGPQPETAYPLPEGAEATFNYAGSGSWESTRNLRNSARDGFLPWVIVGAAAPRPLIYAHEFAWDQPRDPVWRRLERIYGWHAKRDHLAALQGRGSVRGQPPESTHCNNIGAVHRRQIDPWFARWFGIEIEERANGPRPDAAGLLCLTEDAARALGAQPFHELVANLGAARAARMLGELDRANPQARRAPVRAAWNRLLGGADPSRDPMVRARHDAAMEGQHSFPVTVSRIVLEPESGIVLPLVLLRPEGTSASGAPVVVAFAQAGKRRLLESRSGAFARLLRSGISVCLPDLRGTGETAPAESSRGRTSVATALASTELMLGEPLLGARLRDLRAVLRYLREQREFARGKFALWGDSLAAPLVPGTVVEVPLDAAELPPIAEPMGAHVALLAALFDEQVEAVVAHGGLAGYGSMFQSPFCHLPFDVLVPGAMDAGDLPAVASALAPRPVRMTGLVDGLNRPVPPAQARVAFLAAIEAYRARGAAEQFELPGEPESAGPALDVASALWLADALGRSNRARPGEGLR